MSVRRLIVEVDVAGLNVTKFCAQHGVSIWLFYELRRRHARGESIEPRSRAPRQVANRTPGEVEDVIVGLRKELLDAGLDAGPATIWWHLQDRAGVVASESTIWRILKARGLIVAGAGQGPETRWETVHSGTGQRVLAARRHPMGTRRRHRGEDPQHPR